MTGYADFEAFVVARRVALLRTAYLLTGDHHDAEDLVQAALIKVVPKWARIKDRPEGYVRQVLARESLNRWRGRRWREVTTDVVPETTHHDSTDRIALLEDLRRLSPRQRAVLVLRYFDDLTEADTAAALGISVGTVKSHVRDALTHLRNQRSGEEQAAALRETQGPRTVPGFLQRSNGEQVRLSTESRTPHEGGREPGALPATNKVEPK